MKKSLPENKIGQYTPEDARKLVEFIFLENSDPQNIYSELAEKVMPKFMKGTDEEKEWARRQLLGRSSEAVMTVGLINHYQIIYTAEKQYASLILEITRKIEKEHECTTAVEKILAEQIAMAHIKIIDYSRRFEEWCSSPQSSKVEITKFLEMLGRQIDKANRQLHTAIIVLRQIKQPALSVNINTKNIFTAQNQQINDNSQKT